MMIYDIFMKTITESCPFYRAGAIRKVPGRKGMTWEEEDWVDEEATVH